MSQYSEFIKITFIRDSDKSFPEYDKYKYLFEDVPKRYEEWLEKHYAPIGTKKITDKMLHKAGCYPSSKEEALQQKRKLTNEKNKQAEQIELVRFYNHNLDRILTDANECLSNPKFSKEDKRAELEKCDFEYLMFKVSGAWFLQNELAFRDSVVYTDKLKESIDVRYVKSVFSSLVIPDDYRACKMFFDEYRLFDNASKLYLGFLFSYCSIHNIFTLTNYNGIGFDMMPVIEATLLKEEQEKAESSLIILETISNGLGAALEQLKTAKESLSSADYDHLRRVNHTGPSSIFEENMNRDMKDVTGSPEQIKIAYMVYALAKIMELVDLVIDYLNLYIHKNSNECMGDTGDALRKIHQELRHARGEIQYLCFENDMI